MSTHSGGPLWDCPLDVMSVDVRHELEQIRALTYLGLDALTDQSEGDMRNVVVELHTRAAGLLHLVATW